MQHSAGFFPDKKLSSLAAPKVDIPKDDRSRGGVISVTRIIIFMVALTTAFCNMAWALDVCTPLVNPQEQEAEPLIVTEAGPEHDHCDTLGYCLMETLEIGIQFPYANVGSGDLAVIYPPSFYLSPPGNPPTEPPQI